MVMTRSAAIAFAGLLIALAGMPAAQAQAPSCPVNHDQLVNALKQSVKPSGGPSNGGFDTHQWASVVTRDGTVCAVAFSGGKADDQWPGSRGIAMQKANTANAFSTAQLAISTANVFAQAQPGQSLYGLTQASPPSAEINTGDAAQFGTPSDPMIGKRAGGIIVFGGGLALYNDSGVVGALGVSGDSSCADHNVAWRVRQALGLDKAPAGLSPQRKDAIIYDIGGAENKSASGFGHVKCAGKENEIAEQLQAGVTGPLYK